MSKDKYDWEVFLSQCVFAGGLRLATAERRRQHTASTLP
jgi:hypothetical protein